jgi:hypothetical protein
MLEAGMLKLLFSTGESVILGADGLLILAHALHRLGIFQVSLTMDLCSPLREDWRRITHIYVNQ